MTALIIISCILIQLYLTTLKVSPFISLLIISVFGGLALGIEPQELIKTFEKGVGSTLSGLLLIVCLGAILGKILEESGAAEQISKSLINKFGSKNIHWAVMLAGFFVGIPLFYNAGFVILFPLIISVVRSAKVPILSIAIPMAASLSVTHCFLPPHPGPVLLINTFNADFGKTLIYGLIIAVPAVIIGGPILGKFFKNEISFNKSNTGITNIENKKLPSFKSSLVIALMPVFLILIGATSKIFLEHSFLRILLQFIGESMIALLFTVIIALYYFGSKKGISFETQSKWISSAVEGIAMILLIIASAGIFKQVLIDSGTADQISDLSGYFKMPPIVFAWCITALIRISIGSATVAAITAAGIVAPLVNTEISPELIVLSIGAGSVFGSHINDSGFWMFKEYFNLSLKQTLLSWTLMESLISVIGLAGVLILDIFI
jgi:Gnt-I system high-affinity gluconate transporter